MSGTSDKIQGRIKQAAGDLTGNDDLENEGERDEAAGTAKDAIGDAADKVKDGIDKVRDKIG
jgi:uncharacterized protein YjbJ (UPF0337 family)